MSLDLIKTWLNLKSNFLDQNNPKSKYYCKNELIYIRDFEAVKKPTIILLSGVKILAFASSLKTWLYTPAPFLNGS